MNPTLDLQRQPTPVTCVQTCIAMALGVPVAEVIRVFGGSAMNQRLLIAALERCGVVYNQFVFGCMAAVGWYFAVVPSLNRIGGNHQVLFHWDGEGGLTVLDPALGKTYKPDGSDVISWSDLTYFHPGGRLPEALP